jgi:hypothetical protein
MASLTVNVPNADVPDALAAIERIWANDAVRLFFGGDATAYAASTPTVRAKACVGAWITVMTKNYRTEINQGAAPIGTEPAIS